MGKVSGLPIIQAEAAQNRRMTRRKMVQRLIAGAGAGAAWPLVAGSHPIYEHLANGEMFEEAEKLGATNWKPLFLNAQQEETLAALAEAIVPGSRKARADRFIDLLLSVDTTEHKKNFIDSLAAFETESQKRFGRRFPALNAGEQNALLTDASTRPAKESATGGDRKEDPGLRGHFENLKGWISGAYYSSEAGMRELGWTEDRVFEKFPGCEHPEGHH
ncbi:MAG: gluconate 2-dehydrogenase subunit 3 family protein [Candidatus Acidiferrum sp.]